MPLTAGTRIGSYEIIAVLGSGGMGEVYRARDFRLGRDVAVKALSDDAHLDAGRIARFQREAQILASLNHPHIAAIYGLEEATLPDRSTASRFLILELVTGGTLADRIARGVLPLHDAMTVARQLADALQTAHDQGIIHRDLKPANVALTPDGQVKVLDFGIAKIRARSADDAVTMTHATEHGAVMGTVGYMSPEQARGQSLDKRTDIWSFGCVLYEALTGAAPFRGATASDTIAGILGREPEFSTLPASTPPRIVWLLRRCLEKDPRRRLHDIADARIEIEEALAPERGGLDAASVVPSRWPAAAREMLAWIAAGVAAIAAGIAWTLLARGATAPPIESGVVARSSVVLPADVRLLATEDPSARFAISPDAKRLALVATSVSGEPRLYVRPIDGQVPQPLAGTEGASHPFWSADSASIAFVARPGSADQVSREAKVKRIDLDTGHVTTLADVMFSTGGTWNADGVILFTPGGSAPIHRVAASGGAPTAVTALDQDAGDVLHAQPFFLPDGNHFLFSVIGSRTVGATAARGVFVASLDRKTPPTLVLDGGYGAKYANGHLIFTRAGRLLAQPFDATTLRATGDPRQLAEGLQQGGGSGGGAVGAFSVSERGVIVYQAVVPIRMQLAWFDRNGARLSLLGGEADYADVTLSRDGRRAAVSVLDPLAGSRDIHVYDVARNLRERVTSNPADDFAPVWSPGGDRLAFSSLRQGRVDLFTVSATAPGEETLIAAPGLDLGKFAATWSPRDDLVFIHGGRVIARSDLWSVGVKGDRQPFVVAQTPAVETQARLSPDGRWLAYVTNESAEMQVYVQPFPGSGSRQRISVESGRYPIWSHDGSEVFFVGRDNRLMAASVRLTETAAQIGAIRPLFTFQFHRIRLDAYPYDVSPDGRFLVNSLVEESAPAAISLLINWPAGLSR